MLAPALLEAANVGLGTLAAGFGAAASAWAAAIGISKIGSRAMDAIGRQPEAANDIRMSMIVASALIEGACLFAIVVCFMAL